MEIHMKKIIMFLTTTLLIALLITSCKKDDTTEKIVIESKELISENYELSLNGKIGDATKVDVIELLEDSTDYINAKEKLELDGLVALRLVNISLLDNQNNKVQPNGTVTIEMNIPEDLANADGDIYYVYRTESDGSITKLKNSVLNSEIKFSTKHFSVFIIVKAKSSTVIETDTLAENGEETTTVNDSSDSNSRTSRTNNSNSTSGNNIGINTGTNTGANTETGTSAGTGTETGTSTETGTETETGTSTETGTETETGTSTETGTETGTSTETGASTETDTGSETDTNTETSSDSEIVTNPEPDLINE